MWNCRKKFRKVLPDNLKVGTIVESVIYIDGVKTSIFKHTIEAVPDPKRFNCKAISRIDIVEQPIPVIEE